MHCNESDQTTNHSINEDWDITFCETFDQLNTVVRCISSKKDLYLKGQIPVIERFEETINEWNLRKKFLFFIYYYERLVKNPIFYQIIGSQIFENIILIQTINKRSAATPFKLNYCSRYLTTSNKFSNKEFFNLKNNLCTGSQNNISEKNSNKEFLLATRENLQCYKDSHLFIKRLRFLKFNRKFVNSTNFQFISKCKNLHTYETNYPRKLPRLVGVKKLVISLKRNSEIPFIAKTFLKNVQTMVVYVDPPRPNESHEEFTRYMQKVSRKTHQKNFVGCKTDIKLFVVRL